MSLLKLLIALIVLVTVAGAAFYFAPDSVKDKGLAFIDSQKLIPAEVKTTLDKLYATPNYQREKLMAQLDESFNNIRSTIENPPKNETARQEALQSVEKAQSIVQKLATIPSDPTLVSQVANLVTSKVLSAVNQNSCPAAK